MIFFFFFLQVHYVRQCFGKISRQVKTTHAKSTKNATKNKITKTDTKVPVVFFLTAETEKATSFEKRWRGRHKNFHATATGGGHLSNISRARSLFLDCREKTLDVTYCVVSPCQRL